MKPVIKRTAAIVGVSALSLGLVIGTGIAANAASFSIANALHHSQFATPSSTATPTPIRTHGPRGNDVNDNATNNTDANDTDANDDNGQDATEHPTPEPGDDDAPGTPDHHGETVGGDDGDAGHGSNRGPGNSTDGPVPAPAPSPVHEGSSDDGGGHDAGDN